MSVHEEFTRENHFFAFSWSSALTKASLDWRSFISSWPISVCGQCAYSILLQTGLVSLSQVPNGGDRDHFANRGSRGEQQPSGDFVISFQSLVDSRCFGDQSSPSFTSLSPGLFELDEPRSSHDDLHLRRIHEIETTSVSLYDRIQSDVFDGSFV